MNGTSVAVHPAADARLIKRLWIYQAERFPMFKTALLLAVFSAASISMSAHLAARPLPEFWTFIAVWISTLVIFFQMRACDEFKDLEDDRRFRPERPIPSGLVSLQLIATIAIIGTALAIALTASLLWALLLPLSLVWVWLSLMTTEFFAPDWLKARPALYLISHMAIMPLIDLYITAAEWLPHGRWPPNGLWVFLCMSFVNGCVLEFGRKIWAPENERDGVETYSKLMGPKLAICTWLGLTALALMLLLILGHMVGAFWQVTIPSVCAFLVVFAVARSFARRLDLAGQKRVDGIAGLWVFVCYSVAGFAPFLERLQPW